MLTRGESGTTAAPFSSPMEGEKRTMTIREMESRDLEELLPMEQASSLTPWSRKMFMDELTDPLGSCFVLMVEDPSRPILAGFTCFRSVGNESELLNLSVHPLHRRQGVGRRLMQFYLDRCAAQGIERSYLEVSVSNEAALGLYFSLSYEKVGMRKGFYQGRVNALLLMKRI